MDTGLKGKVAIVTGAALGLGRAIAFSLAAEGACVVVADTKLDEAKRVVAEIQHRGGTALALKTDVTRYKQVQTMVDKSLSAFGHIDILVNNAGVVGPQDEDGRARHEQKRPEDRGGVLDGRLETRAEGLPEPLAQPGQEDEERE